MFPLRLVVMDGDIMEELLLQFIMRRTSSTLPLLQKELEFHLEKLSLWLWQACWILQEIN